MGSGGSNGPNGGQGVRASVGAGVLGKGGNEKDGTLGGSKRQGRRHLELGVMHRTPMGEYVPRNGAGLSGLCECFPFSLSGFFARTSGQPKLNLSFHLVFLAVVYMRSLYTSKAIPTPGPLDYDPQLPPSGFQYSILGKHTNSKSDDAEDPGPNQYNCRSFVFSETPKWSFGMKLEDKSKKGKAAMLNCDSAVTMLNIYVEMQHHLADNGNPSPFAYNDTHGAFGKDGYAYTISGWFPTAGVLFSLV
jgi:hypothetical protein